MGLLSIFKRRPATPSAAGGVGEPGDAVQRARTRARQRLIGAVVLVGIGVVGFPLVFETQPRPIPVDIPIEVPRKESAAPLTIPPTRVPVADSSASAVRSLPSVAPTAGASPSDEAAEGSRDAESQTASPQPAPRATGKSVDRNAAVVEPTKPGTEPKQAKSAAESKSARSAQDSKTASPSDSARAKSLLEGKTVASAETGRFVLQVGAFSDTGAAHDAQLKAEKLGLKTFTQVVSTPGGSRIRVRVGPFASRDEADTALAKARSGGLSAVVLTL
jgi:DedD protein